MIDKFVFDYDKYLIFISFAIIFFIINIILLLKNRKYYYYIFFSINIIFIIFIFLALIEPIFYNKSFLTSFIEKNLNKILESLKNSNNQELVNLYYNINSLTNINEKIFVLTHLISYRMPIVFVCFIVSFCQFILFLFLKLLNIKEEFFDYIIFKLELNKIFNLLIFLILFFVPTVLISSVYFYLFKTINYIPAKILNLNPSYISINYVNNNFYSFILSNKTLYIYIRNLIGIPFIYYTILLFSNIFIKSKIFDKSEIKNSIENDINLEKENKLKNLEKVLNFLDYVKNKYNNLFEGVLPVKLAYDENAFVRENEKFTQLINNEKIPEDLKRRIKYLENLLNSIELNPLYNFQNDYLKNLLNKVNSVLIHGHYAGVKTIVIIGIIYKVLIENKCVLVLVKQKEDAEVLEGMIKRMFSKFLWFTKDYYIEIFSKEKFIDYYFGFPTIIFSTIKVMDEILESLYYRTRGEKNYFFQNLDMIYFDELHKFDTAELLNLPYFLQRLNLIIKSEQSSEKPFITASLVPYQNLYEFLTSNLSIYSESEIINIYRRNKYTSNQLFCVLKLFELGQEISDKKRVVSEIIKNALLEYEIYPILFVGFSEFYDKNDFEELLAQIEENIHKVENKDRFPRIRDIVNWYNEHEKYTEIYKDVKLIICSGEIKSLYKSLYYFNSMGINNYLVSVIIVCKDPLEEFYAKYYLKFWGLKEYNDYGIYSYKDYLKYLPKRIISGNEILNILIKKNIIYLLFQSSYTKEEISSIFKIDINEVEKILEEFSKYLKKDRNNKYSFKLNDEEDENYLKKIRDQLINEVYYNLKNMEGNILGTYPVRYLETMINPIYHNNIFKERIFLRINDKKYKIINISEKDRVINLGNPIQYGYDSKFNLIKKIKIDFEDYKAKEHNFNEVDNSGNKGILREYFDKLKYEICFIGIFQFNFCELKGQIDYIVEKNNWFRKEFLSRALIIKIERIRGNNFKYVNKKTIKLFANLIKQMVKMVIEEPLTNIESIYANLNGEHYIFIFDYSNPDSSSIKEIEKSLTNLHENILMNSIINFLEYITSLQDQEKVKNILNQINNIFNMDRDQEDKEEFNLEDYNNLKKFLVEDLKFDPPDLVNYEYINKFNEDVIKFLKDKKVIIEKNN